MLLFRNEKNNMMNLQQIQEYVLFKKHTILQDAHFWYSWEKWIGEWFAMQQN